MYTEQLNDFCYSQDLNSLIETFNNNKFLCSCYSWVALDDLNWIFGFWVLYGYKAIYKFLVIIIYGLNKRSRLPKRQTLAVGIFPLAPSQLTLGTRG